MEEEKPPSSEGPSGRIALPIVVARILIVSGIAFGAALALFLLIGGAWPAGLIALAATFVFILLMFLLEWSSERGGRP